jgi:hypothetical protein
MLRSLSGRRLAGPLGASRPAKRKMVMNGIIYLVGLVVVVLVIASFLGLR